MPSDPILAAEARAWHEAALCDLAAGQHDLRAQPPFIGDSLFHAQQAVEKTLKALLISQSQPVRMTYDLELLGSQCAALIPSLEPALRRPSDLTEYAWKFRYPGATEAPKLEEAESGLRLAETISALIRPHLDLE